MGVIPIEIYSSSLEFMVHCHLHSLQIASDSVFQLLLDEGQNYIGHFLAFQELMYNIVSTGTVILNVTNPVKIKKSLIFNL